MLEVLLGVKLLRVVVNLYFGPDFNSVEKATADGELAL